MIDNLGLALDDKPILKQMREIRGKIIHPTDFPNEFSYWGTETEGGHVDRYQCNNCQYILKTSNEDKCRTFDEVKEYLKRNQKDA